MFWSTPFDNIPLSEQVARDAEARFRVTLPESYVELLREQNGGYVEERLVPVSRRVPASLAPYVSNGYVSVGSIFGIDPASEAGSIYCSDRMRSEWDLPEAVILLDGDGHTWIGLDYRQRPDSPSVVLLVSGVGELELAPDFDSFLSRMIPYEAVYDENGVLREHR